MVRPSIRRARISEEHLIAATESRLRKVFREEMDYRLKSLGIDPDSVVEMQKDMAWLRAWRRVIIASINKAGLTIIGILVLGLIAAAMAASGYGHYIPFIGAGLPSTGF